MMPVIASTKSDRVWIASAGAPAGAKMLAPCTTSPLAFSLHGVNGGESAARVRSPRDRARQSNRPGVASSPQGGMTMGLISFIKAASAYPFGAGAGNAVAATQAKPVTTDILKQQVDILGIPVKDLKVAFADPVATVGGVVGSNSDKEKIALAVGNTPGVGKVDDQLAVEGGGAAAAAPAAKMYTVKKGDTLSAIAKAEYGDGNKYPVIFDANKPMLKDPNKIYPGQLSRIPPKP